MKTVRIVSKILHVVALVLSVLYLATSLYSCVVLTLKTPQFSIIDGGRRFKIVYPFTDTAFLLGENTVAQMTTMVLLIGLYGVFFYLISNVFRIFSGQKWFTEQGINRLRWFYLSNFTVPITVYALFKTFWAVESPAELLVALHGLLGVFTFFIAAIFEQGLHLQNEQDLII